MKPSNSDINQWWTIVCSQYGRLIDMPVTYLIRKSQNDEVT